VLQGRYYVSQEDIRAVALPVPAAPHQRPTFSADAEGVSADDLVRRVIESVPSIAEESGERGTRRPAVVPDVFRPADAG